MPTIIGASSPDQTTDPARLTVDVREFRRPIERALIAIGEGADTLSDLARLLRAVHDETYLDLGERDAAYIANTVIAAARSATEALLDMSRHVGAVQALTWVRDEAIRDAEVRVTASAGEDDVDAGG